MARTDAITDFQQFTGLRAQAQRGEDAAVRKVAQQFEALFTQQMLKNMRSSALANDVLGGGQSDFYQDIFDQQMAVHMSSGKGLGLADVLVQQLRGKQAAAAALPPKTGEAAGMALTKTAPAHFMALSAATAAADHALLDATTEAVGSNANESATAALPSPAQLQRLARVWAQASAPAAGEAMAGGEMQPLQMQNAAGLSAADTADAGGATQDHAQRFIAAIQPHAERAARQLGVPAQVLMAQAALETGWGKHAVRDSSGASSFNFFGIKADKSWQGSRMQTTTSEYRDGQPQSETAQFRAYDSPAAAFDDYVDFLKSNPRYAAALRSGGNPAAFAYGLQNAGYATDPAYAQKLLKVAYGSTMRAAMAQVPRRFAV